MGKSKTHKINTHLAASMALGDQINDGRIAKNKLKNPKIRMRAEEEGYVDAKTSHKILKIARKQQNEMNTNDFPTPSEAKKFGFYDKKKKEWDNFSSTEEEDSDNDDNDKNMDFYDDIKVDPEDERALVMFQNKNGVRTKSLAEAIKEKISEKQTEIQTQFSESGAMQMEKIDPRVVEMYEGIRDVMMRHRSGKIPKAFKIIPKLKNWEQFLHITAPQMWSAASVYRATRLFCSGLTDNMAQRFYNLVLLPRVRDDLNEYNRLNTYIYRSLKKALFKPGAFMKGIIIPLLESGDCTLREAIIFGNVISSSTIPVLHAASVLLQICEMEYSGANSIFIRIILDKGYALPYRVIDAAVFHFLKFETDKRELPTLWHQSFITFVQKYKNDISSEQREALLQLLKKKYHPKISPQIRNELNAAQCRDVEMGTVLDEEQPSEELPMEF